MLVPDAPGLGIDIVEEAIANYPSDGNVSIPATAEEPLYVKARTQRARWLHPAPQSASTDFD